MFKDSLPSSLNSLGTLHRHTQRSLPLVIPDLVKLTTKVSIVYPLNLPPTSISTVAGNQNLRGLCKPFTEWPFYQ